MTKTQTRWCCGFSLIELVVVVAIVGLIAAMAIPRFSRGSVAASEAATANSLKTVRAALQRYASEHRDTFPGPDVPTAVKQLTCYTSGTGAYSPTFAAPHIYGPYLLAIPPCPIGYNPGSNEIALDNANSPPAPQPNSNAGWVYNSKTGEFYPNASSEELAKVAYGQLPSSLEGGG